MDHNLTPEEQDEQWEADPLNGGPYGIDHLDDRPEAVLVTFETALGRVLRGHENALAQFKRIAERLERMTK